VKTFTKITIVVAAIFLFLQVGVQLCIGENPYILWDWWEQFTHSIGAMTLGAIFLIVLTLPKGFDQWKYWIPLMAVGSTLIMGFAYEIIELVITRLALMPPSQMYATPFNSFVIDMWHDFLGALAVAFVWEECRDIEMMKEYRAWDSAT
jgi:hypothetical protein